MAQTIKLKRSATSGAVPATSALELGEVAINTHDGKVYIKKDDGTESVVEVGDKTPAELLTAIKTVDGSGSGLDADTVDGLHGTDIVETSDGTSGNLDTEYDAQMFSWSTSTTGKPADNYGQGISIVSSGKTHNNSNNWITQLGFGTTNNTSYFRTKVNYGGWSDWRTIWNSANDGSGSGLDADLLDGQHGSYYYPASNPNGYTSNVGDITGVTAGTGLSGGGASGSVTLNLSNTMAPAVATELSSSVDLDTLNGSAAGFYYQTANSDTAGNNYPNGQAGSLIVQKSAGNATQLYQTYSTSPELFFRSNYTAGYTAWRKVWHDGNDGSGSGLDADLLDGQHGSAYLRSNVSATNSVDLRAPVFYDSGNTGNYLDSPTSSVFRLNGSTAVNLAVGGSTKLVADASGIDVTGRVVATEDTDALRLRSSTNGVGVNINFSDHAAGGYAQNGSIRYVHTDGSSYGSGNAFIVESTESNMTFLADGKLMFKEGLYLKPATGTGAGSQIISSDGTFSVPEYIYHQSNTGTYIRYLTNRIITRAGSGAQHDMHSNGNQYFTGKSIFYTGVDINAGNLEIGATTVIDSSRNLTNIVDITSTGTVYLDNPNNSSTSNPNIDSLGELTTGTAYSYHALFKDGNGNIKGRITHNQYGAQFSNLSDYRAKEDYQEVENATSRLMSIPVRNFQWVGSSLRTDGFIAHEIAEVVPEAVVGEKDAVLEDGTPDYQSIDQAKLIPLLVKTIQELEARITALENA
jgi:hypothetical protein